jgi:hypothetical protein
MKHVKMFIRGTIYLKLKTMQISFNFKGIILVTIVV